jgi:hypothetical protein
MATTRPAKKAKRVLLLTGAYHLPTHIDDLVFSSAQAKHNTAPRPETPSHGRVPRGGCRGGDMSEAVVTLVRSVTRLRPGGLYG